MLENNAFTCYAYDCGPCFGQLARHNKILLNLLKPAKRTEAGEEGISSMVSVSRSHFITFVC